MVDLSVKTFLTLRQAALQAPGQPHVSTINRWWRRGIRGVRLETYLIGGKRFTTLESLSRFFAATTAASIGETANVAEPPKPNRKGADRAANELAEMLSSRAGT